MPKNKPKTMQKKTPLIFFLSLSVLAACITACGQKGALYLPQDNTSVSTTSAEDIAVTKNTATKTAD